MFYIILVEGEQASLQYLELLIRKIPQLKIMGSFKKAEDVLQYSHIKDLDAAFLDIEMPGMNGIELAKLLIKINPQISIIYVTAFEQYAVEAFQLAALHYLLKPISLKQIEATVERLHRVRGIEHNKEMDWQYEVKLFGNFQVNRCEGKEPILWSTKKAEELFAFFLYKNGQKVEKTRLHELLWPDSDEKSSQHNLHTTLYRMKKNLRIEESGMEVEYKTECYKLAITSIKCDVYEFLNFTRKKPELTEQTVKVYESFFLSYQGEVLQDKNYDWSYRWQLQVNREYWKLTQDLVKYYIVKERYENAERILNHYISFQPWDEEAYEQLLYIYYRMKDRILLIKAYKTLCQILDKELQLEPTKEITTLYQKYIRILSKET